MKQNKFNVIVMLALIGLMACGPLAQAQDTNKPAMPSTGDAAAPGARRGGLGGPFRAIVEKLKLSDDQKPKFQEAVKSFMEEAKGSKDLTREERMAKRKEAFTGLDNQLKTILTPEQFTTWQTESAKMRAGRGSRGGAAVGAPAASTDGASSKQQ